MTIEADEVPTGRTSSDQMEQFRSGDNEDEGRRAWSQGVDTLDEEKMLKKSSQDSTNTTTSVGPKGGPSMGPIFPGEDGFDENNAALSVVINEWAQGTSIHGVPLVTDSTVWKLWKRSVWIFLVLVSSGFMLWQIDPIDSTISRL